MTRLEVAHRPWPLQLAEAEVECCTMTQPLGIELAAAPDHVRYAHRLDVVAWLPRRVR
jgi:hypothetical protein